MAQRLIETIKLDAASPHSVKVYRDTEYDTIVVKLFDAGKHYEPADYETDDRDDAIATGKKMLLDLVRQSNPSQKDDDMRNGLGVVIASLRVVLNETRAAEDAIFPYNEADSVVGHIHKVSRTANAALRAATALRAKT